MSIRKRVRKMGLSSQPWRKADMAYLRKRAAKDGLELEFKVEGDGPRSRVRTVYVYTPSTPLAYAFITEYLAFPSPYRARAIAKQTVVTKPEQAVAPPTLEPCCSFCGKHQNDVKYMVAGPAVFICDGCVQLCRDVGGVHEFDAQALSLIVKLVRTVPADVPAANVPEAIDRMMEEQLHDVSLWRDLRGLSGVSVQVSGRPFLQDYASLVAAVGMGANAYLWGAREGKTSPTSAEVAASGTAGEVNQ